MDYSSFLDKLKILLKSNDQTSFLSDTVDTRKEILESLCVDYLKHCGYKIINPFSKFNSISVNSNKELLWLFNDLKYSHYGVHGGSAGVTNIDLKYIKDFVKARMEANGCSMPKARKECALIIETIFSNLDKFNFREPPRPVVLGQQSFGWVTKKAIDIIDAEYSRYLEEETRKIRSKANDIFNDDEFGLV